MSVYGYPTTNAHVYSIPSADSLYTIPTPSHESSSAISPEELEEMVKKAVQDAMNSQEERADSGRYGGEKTYEQLPTPSAETAGIIYNITNAFTTDSRFIEGAGKSYPAGTSIYDNGSKYDVLMGEIGRASDESIQDIINNL